MPCVSLQRKYNDDKAKENLINMGKLTMELALEDLVAYLQKQYRVDTLGGHKELLRTAIVLEIWEWRLFSYCEIN